MYNTNDTYKNYINSSYSRASRSKVVIDGVEYGDDVLMSFPSISHAIDTFIGGFPSKTCTFEIRDEDGTLSLNNKWITVYRGLYISDSVQWIPMGIFKAINDEDIKTNKSKKTITFKGYDKRQLLDTTYVSTLDWSTSHTGLEIVKDACGDLELGADTFNFASYVFTQQPNFSSDITRTEVISRMAEIGGEIALITRQGKVLIKGPSETDMTITRGKRKTLVKENTFGPITMLVLGNEGYDDDVIYGTEGVEWRIENNPFVELIRETIIETVASFIIGRSIIPFEISEAIDDYILDINDIITIEDNDGTTFSTTILSYDTTSRIRSTIKAPTQATTLSNYEIAGGVKGVKADLNKVKLEVDHINNKITSLVETTETIEKSVSDLENSIDSFSVDLSQYNIVIPTDSDQKTTETKNYDISFYGYFRGKQITPNVSINGSNTGITTSKTDSYIRFAVSNSTVIPNVTNEYEIDFTYTEDRVTHSLTKIVDIVLSIRGEDGSDGSSGKDGSDGKSAYQIWLDAGNTGTEEDYLASLKGEPGETGKTGADGKTYYTWIKYADSTTSGMSDSPNGKKYMGIAYNKTTATESTNYSDYAWSLIKGEDGSDGSDGEDGISVTSVTNHYAVSTSNTTAPTTGWSETMPTRASGEYLWVKELIAFSDGSSEYTTAFVVTGDRGEQGIQGATGKNGTSYYFYVRYSANANGNPMTVAPQDNSKYMGVASTTSSTAPTSYSAYTWTLIKGADGQNGSPGQNGADGKSSYLHIKYSDDGKTFTANSGETVGRYRGELVDNNPTDSTTFSDYTWYDMALIVEEELEEIRTEVTKNTTLIEQTDEKIRLDVSEQYINTGTFDEFKKETQTQFTIQADGVETRFSEVTLLVEELENGTQEQFTELSSYIRGYQQDGKPVIELGSNTSNIILKMLNDRISFVQNGTEVAYISSNQLYITDGNFLNSLTIGKFAFKPRANGNVSLLKVGD